MTQKEFLKLPKRKQIQEIQREGNKVLSNFSKYNDARLPYVETNELLKLSKSNLEETISVVTQRIKETRWNSDKYSINFYKQIKQLTYDEPYKVARDIVTKTFNDYLNEIKATNKVMGMRMTYGLMVKINKLSYEDKLEFMNSINFSYKYKKYKGGRLEDYMRENKESPLETQLKEFFGW